MFSKRVVLKNKKVKVFSDNQNIKTILKAGSMKNDLLIIALDIYEFCTTNNITVIPVWIPRQQNERADYLSRSFDCDDWEISDNVFSILDRIWGLHSIDRFASNYSSKCF